MKCFKYWRVRPCCLRGGIIVRLICGGSMSVGLKQREGIQEKGQRNRKKGRHYLLDSRCLLASPGLVCSSVTEREKERISIMYSWHSAWFTPSPQNKFSLSQIVGKVY